MATVGDISQDKLTDVAIGAPLEGLGAGDDISFGSVYIYNGRRDGLSTHCSQVTRRALSCFCPGVGTTSSLSHQMCWPEAQVSPRSKHQAVPQD